MVTSKLARQGWSGVIKREQCALEVEQNKFIVDNGNFGC